MVKMILIAGAMLLSLLTYSARAADGSGAVESANLLPEISDQRWGLFNWLSEVHCKMTPEEGGVRIDITKLRSEPARTDLSLGCRGVTAKAGKAYMLRFSAKASEPRQITIAATEPAKLEESLMGRAPTELKTTWQTYVCRVVLTRDVTPMTRLPSFELGDKLGTVWFRNITLVPADGSPAAAPAATPAPTATPAPPAAAAETAAKNVFPNATSPDQWIVSQKGSARGAMEQQDNRLRLTVTAAGTDRWSFRIQHRGVAVAAGQTLTLKFSARASTSRKITISSQQAQPPMSDLTDEVVLDVGTDWQEYSHSFTFANGTTPNDLFPIIELGDQVGSLWLRDISLTEPAGETRSEAMNATPGRAIAPPAPPAASAGPAAVTGVSSIPDMTKEGTYRFVARGGSGQVRKEGDGLVATFARNTGRANTADTELRYIHLECGRKYRLRFSAKAETPVQTKVVVQNDVAPFEEEFIAPVSISLTTEWQDVDMKLDLTKQPAETMCSIAFMLGQVSNSISFRNGSIVSE